VRRDRVAIARVSSRENEMQLHERGSGDVAGGAAAAGCRCRLSAVGCRLSLPAVGCRLSLPAVGCRCRLLLLATTA